MIDFGEKPPDYDPDLKREFVNWYQKDKRQWF